MASPLEILSKITEKNRAPDIHARTQNIPFRQDATAPARVAKLTRQIFPPWVYKLPGAQDFNQNNYNTVLAAGAGSVVVPVAFQLPQDNVGWLQIFGVFVLTPTALTNILFTLRINQAPVSGWDNIQVLPIASNGIVQNFNDLQVRVPNNATVDVLVTNQSAAGPWTVGAKIAGWYQSRHEEQRLYGDI